MTDDFVDHGSPFPIPPGPEGYAQILGFVTSVLKIRYELEDLSQIPERIVIRATAHGTGTAAFHGPGADGKPSTMTTLHIFGTEGDRLAEHWGVRDEVGAMRQMGLLPQPLSPCPDGSRHWRVCRVSPRAPWWRSGPRPPRRRRHTHLPGRP